MGYAYTPGLKVAKYTTIRKERKLPIKGNVLVKEGQYVRAEDIIAKTEIPGNVSILNIAGLLGINPQEIRKYLVKKEGEEIKKGEPIAINKVLFGLIKNPIVSPIDGFVESISEITGQIILREHPIPIQINAYVDGKVVKVIEDEGVEIETKGAFIQGIFGIGGERIGKIRVAVNSPDEELKIEHLKDDESGNIIIGGSYVKGDVIKEAMKRNAYGIVVGGIDDYILKEILGYDIGVAITGNEDINTTIIITEGFGKISMANRTFELLKSLDGYKASINGATQIRAGVMRPEIVVPLKEGEEVQSSDDGTLRIGKLVRIIRAPYFGLIGKVVELPVEPITIETESRTRILKVQVDGKVISVPRANVELIEE